jgi:hypothetical protein
LFLNRTSPFFGFFFFTQDLMVCADAVSTLSTAKSASASTAVAAAKKAFRSRVPAKWGGIRTDRAR